MLGGELSFHFLTVVLLTLAIAPLVLWRYRRAVLRGMQPRPGPLPPLPAGAPAAGEATDNAATAAEAEAGADAGLEPGSPGAVAVTDAGAGTSAGAGAGTGADADASAAKLAWEQRLRRRVLVAALFATFVSALPLTVVYLYLGGLPPTPAHLFFSAASTSLAAVPVYAVLTATRWPGALAVGLATALALAACVVVVTLLQRAVLGRPPSLDQLVNFALFLQFAALTLWLPLLLGAATGARRVRGVAPLAFAGLLVFALAPLLGLRLTQWLTGTRSGSGWVLDGPGLETGFVLLALPAGLLAWRRLTRLAHAYEAKRYSDAQLLAANWWLLVVAVVAVQLVAAHPGDRPLALIVAAGAASYLMHAPLLRAALRRARRGLAAPPARMLLLLRVFGDTRRTEALFDRVAARWRLFGPLAMIAAPDVVARTVDPGDVLRFAVGDIGTVFVNTRADLQRRLAALDRLPDPDGRFRVNDFCCRDTTWQATVVELIGRADVVLMDLRGFDAGRAGCEFELRQIAGGPAASRTVLVVDGTTDRALLARIAGTGAAAMRTIDANGPGGGGAVFGALLAAAA